MTWNRKRHNEKAQRHRSTHGPFACSLRTMVKRCHIFTGKWREKARVHPGNMFKKLIYVSCWALHLQFKQNSTLPPHRVYFIRYEGVTRSCVIKTVINWKEKVPPEFWEAVNFICLTALLLVLFSVWAYFVLKIWYSSPSPSICLKCAAFLSIIIK